MTQYLVFDNQKTGGIGTQKELVINWSNVKYIEPVSSTSFKLQLNNGGSLTFTLSFSSTSNSAAVIQSIQDVIKSQANGKVLRVKPKTIGGFVITGVTYASPATLASIPSNINSGLDIMILGSTAVNSGPGNTGYGFDAMSMITSSADSNVGIGSNALKSCNGDDNVAVGYNAMPTHYDGGKNVAIGYDCMEKSGDAEGAANNSNTFVGAQSGMDIDEGCSDNVGMGRSALQNIGTSGSSCNQNTAVGSGAGTNLQGPCSNNTMLGFNAEPSGSSVSNEFVLGNSSVAVLRCQQGTISALSDERDKTNIEDLPYGLDFVNSLKPKRFVWDNRPEIRLVDDEQGNRVVEEEYFSANKGKKDVGFIAQELQTVDNEFLNLVYDSNPEKLEASYGKLIPVLVKAIQELKAELDKKQDK